MTLLVVSLPLRLPAGLDAARAGAAAAPDDAPRIDVPLEWLASGDGLHVAQHGVGTPAGWPTADTVVAVAPAGAVAWHRVVVPKAPAARLRAALGSVVEERLLGDDTDVHLALAPGAQAGAEAWVAVCSRRWLGGWLRALEAAGFAVDRVVPALTPAAFAGADAVPRVHFHLEPVACDATSAAAPTPLAVDADALTDPTTTFGDLAPRVSLAAADGAVCLPLDGPLVAQRIASQVADGARCTATPPLARRAEAWLAALPEAPALDIVDANVDWLAAARRPWSLAQFDLAPRRAGVRQLGDVWRLLRSPAWRPVRWGAALFVAANLVGLNAAAWQQQRALGDERAAMDALLRSTFPQVRVVLDAPAQMQRETQRLRAAAGVPAPGDWDSALSALALAWPEGQPPAAQWRYVDGRLSWPSAGWNPAHVDTLRQRLSARGFALEVADGRMTVSPAAAPTAGAPATAGGRG